MHVNIFCVGSSRVNGVSKPRDSEKNHSLSSSRSLRNNCPKRPSVTPILIPIEISREPINRLLFAMYYLLTLMPSCVLNIQGTLTRRDGALPYFLRLTS